MDRSKRAEPRGRPVEFEREMGTSMPGPIAGGQQQGKQQDPFGDIDAFLKEAKR